MFQGQGLWAHPVCSSLGKSTVLPDMVHFDTSLSELENKQPS